MYFAFKTYPGGGAFALFFFHPHPREFATQNKKSANARGLARGGGRAQLELTDALRLQYRSCYICMFSNTFNYCYIFVYVVVQFYPWFNFYLPLFYTRYHTLLYTKTN